MTTSSLSPGARARIAAYYDSTHGIYQALWSRHALHYGMWDESTTSHRESLVNTDRYLAERLAPDASSHVLDAGCGVGETGRSLARRFGCRVTGVTLSTKQAETSRLRTEREGLETLVETRIADYEALPFADGLFDAAYGLESLCHARHRPTLCRELFRVVKPNGRILIVDGWLSARARTPRQEQKYRELCVGWQIESLATPSEMLELLANAGFAGARYVDLTDRILPTARYMSRLMKVLYLPVGLPARIGVLPRRWFEHGLACLAQRPLLEEGAMVYGAISAQRSG